MRYRSSSRAHLDADSAEQEFSLSFAALVMILLCFFVYLNAQTNPDAMRSEKVVEALRQHYGGDEGVRRLKEMWTSPSQILEVARQAGFEAIEKDGRYELMLPGMKLFESGDDQVRPEYGPTLRAIAKLVAELGLQARIEGHTDSQAITGGRFRSNWELSAARAVVVLQIFVGAGVPADRVSAAGRAEFVPLATNDTEEGRARNRRVTIVIETKKGTLS